MDAAAAGDLAGVTWIALPGLGDLRRHRVKGNGLAEDDLIRHRITGPASVWEVDIDLPAVARELQLAERRINIPGTQVGDEAPDVLQADTWPVAEFGHDQQLK